MSTELTSIEVFAQMIPEALLAESGKVFYSGRVAFSSSAPLYVLGANPGGDPANYSSETVEAHTRSVLHTLPSNWSAYRDESWEGTDPGTYGMARRVLHLFAQLRLEPGSVPASNLFFVRSSREAHIRKWQATLADLCWPFHALVIEKLQPRVVLCFGKTAGSYVCRKIEANRVVGEFTEDNERKWKSRTFESARGLRVVVATHPSIANWCVPATDPSGLVREALR